MATAGDISWQGPQGIFNLRVAAILTSLGHLAKRRSLREAEMLLRKGLEVERRSAACGGDGRRAGALRRLF